HTWAKQIASGNYQPQAAYEFSPLPAYIMALVYKIFSPEVNYIRLLNTFYGTLTCLFIGLSGRQLGGNRVGLAAGLIAALYEPFILYSIVPLKTALSVLLFAAFVYLFLKFLAKPGPALTILLAITSGLALNVRGNYLVLIPVALAAVIWEGLKIERPRIMLPKLLFSFCASLLLVLAPFALRNYQVTNELILSTTQAGFNLYIGNNPYNPSPYYYPVPFASSVPFSQGTEFTIEASRRVGKQLTAKEASTYWVNEVYQRAKHNPMEFLRKLGQKTLALLNRFEAFDHYDAHFLSQFMPVFRLPFFTFAVVWPFGVAGMLVSSFWDRKALWLLCLFVAYSVTLILFFVNGRYRMPLLVILIPFAANGIRQALASWKKNNQRLLAYSLLILLFGVLQFAPVAGSNDYTLYYNIHANTLYNSNMRKEALKYWEKSSQLRGRFSDSANLALASTYYRHGELNKARAYVDKIPNGSYALARKCALLGEILMASGDWQAALKAYEQSLKINASNNDVRRQFISLLDTLDPARARREYRERS
ncbi:MAG: glycosyltransferase family 39 protein, partial [Desulfoferrobacter sp.]